jgi:ribosomal protein L2
MEKRKMLAKWSAWSAFKRILCVQGVNGSLVGYVMGAHRITIVTVKCGRSRWMYVWGFSVVEPCVTGTFR